MPETILVTGASGFIGRAVVSVLAEGSAQVVGTSRAEPPGGPAPGSLFEACDLSDRAAVRALFARHRPGALVHLAWHMGPGGMRAAENYDWIAYSIDVLSAFAANGGRRAVVCGSCAEYDWRQPGPYAEASSQLSSASEYGVAKAALAKVFADLCRTHGLSGAWARPFFMYGPGEAGHRLVAGVVRSLLADREAHCTAGTQRRDFLHVDDVAAAIVAILESGVEGPVNVASGEVIELRALISEIARQIGRPELIRLGARPMPADEPDEIAADIGRLTHEVGFRPRFDLSHGIADTIAYWKSQHIDIAEIT